MPQTPERRRVYQAAYVESHRDAILARRRARYAERRTDILEHLRERRRELAGPKPTPQERFWAKVDRQGLFDCWQWKGATAGRIGERYGQLRWAGGQALAHRVAYQLLVGPIPSGLVIDHLCRNHVCVNPAHLEVVTQRENILRGTGIAARRVRQTHCVNGHAFTPDNTIFRREGGRTCLACRTANNRRHQLLAVQRRALSQASV